MLIQIILFLLLGILFGTITGLIPGIHTNLIGIIIVGISASIFRTIDPIYFVVLISSMAITHTFIDFIPSVFLGCPDTDTELSILPGHELLQEGKGYEAVMLTLYGSVFAIIVLILIAYPSIIFIPKINEIITPFLSWILIGASALLILTGKNKIASTIVFILSGILGIFVLNSGTNESLLPLLTGLFGSSILILSIKNKIKIPKQEITFSKTKLSKSLLGSVIAAPLCSFLPGLGSGQAAVLGNLFSKENKKGFLALLGATNTLVMGFSFISLYTISKTRTGAASAIKEIIGIPSINLLILILITTLVSGIISFFIAKKLTKIISQKIPKINYTIISISTLILLTIIISIFSGWKGILIFITSTIIGIYFIQLNVRRTNMMGCLMIPTILYYFGIL